MSCRWSITEIEKKFTVYERHHYKLFGRATSNHLCHSICNNICDFRPERNVDARRVYAHAAAKLLLRIPYNRSANYRYIQQIANSVEGNQWPRVIKMTCGNDISWGQIKMTQHLDSQNRWLRGAYYLYPEHAGYIWKWYSMWANQNYPTSGSAENKITLGLHNFTQNILITYVNDIPWGQIAITPNMDSWKHDYTGPQCFYSTHEDCIWE